MLAVEVNNGLFEVASLDLFSLGHMLPLNISVHLVVSLTFFFTLELELSNLPIISLYFFCFITFGCLDSYSAR
jgi:hypothetical protein